MKYRREIDGLRAVAVLPVILFHAGFSVFSGGYVGVDVFFVISGYLITRILISELEEGRFSIRRFYERRARRILPALFFVMLACLPFAYLWMLPEQLDEFAQSLVAVSLFLSNWLFWSQTGYFETATELKPLLHTWSLAVEEQYYLLFPIFMLVLWRFGRRAVLLLVVAIALCSLLLSEWGWRNEPGINFYFTFSRFWELLAGSICAFMTVDRSPKSNNFLSVFGLSAIIFAVFAYDNATPFPSIYAIVPVGGTALVILFAGQGTWIARLLSMRIFVGVGLISYSAYLWHQPLFAFARLRELTEPSPTVMGLLAATTLLLAWGTWRWIEQPFRRREGQLLATRKKVFAASGIVGGLFVALGLAGHFGNGFAWRYPDIAQREQQINAIDQERLSAIRTGVCHFNRRRLTRDISDVFKVENCSSGNGKTDITFGIYGDSHAADKAVVFRSLGFGTTQLTGAGCPLLPTEYPHSDGFCDTLLDYFVTEKVPSINTIVLSNRFDSAEIDAAYLSDVFAFWGQFGNNVILFSPMPEYVQFNSIFARFGKERASGIVPSRDTISSFWKNLERLDVPDNITIVDTEQVFCGITEGRCSTFNGNESLLTDYGHMSIYGADAFGIQLRSILSHM